MQTWCAHRHSLRLNRITTFLRRKKLIRQKKDYATGRATGLQFPAGAMMKFYSLRHQVQTASWANPTSYPMSTGSSIPWGKAAGGVKLTTYLHLVPRLRMRGALPPLPKYVMRWCLIKKEIRLHGVVLSLVQGQCYKIYITWIMNIVKIYNFHLVYISGNQIFICWKVCVPGNGPV